MLRPTELLVFSGAADPITALLARDYAALGGWSLAVSLATLVVVGFFREWIVPGRQLKRLEEASDKLTEANLELRKQNTMLIQANRISEHFFAETTPKRGETTE